MSFSDDFYDDPPGRYTECCHCGSGDVYWDETPNGWVLKDEDTMQRHDCGSTLFDDIPEL